MPNTNMDAITFIKEKGRMCEGRACSNCPLNKNTGCAITDARDPEEAIRIVSEWSLTHPIKTYKTDFLEKFSKAKMLSANEPYTCMANVYGGNCIESENCEECWNQPLPKELGGQA